MILPAQTIRRMCHAPVYLAHEPLIAPFHDRAVENGMTYGLSACGYDCRIDQDITLFNGSFKLASTMERFSLPNDLMMRVVDKSSWARKALQVQNTVAEPGWRGWLTLELSYVGAAPLHIPRGSPICQVIFERLEAPTDQPYRGRYQDQARGPQPAIEATEAA